MGWAKWYRGNSRHLATFKKVWHLKREQILWVVNELAFADIKAKKAISVNNINLSSVITFCWLGITQYYCLVSCLSCHFYPEALVGSPIPLLIHQSQPTASIDLGRPRGMRTSVWNTQQDHWDPLRTRQVELVEAIKDFWNVYKDVIECLELYVVASTAESEGASKSNKSHTPLFPT